MQLTVDSTALFNLRSQVNHPGYITPWLVPAILFNHRVRGWEYRVQPNPPVTHRPVISHSPCDYDNFLMYYTIIDVASGRVVNSNGEVYGFTTCSHPDDTGQERCGTEREGNSELEFPASSVPDGLLSSLGKKGGFSRAPRAVQMVSCG